MQCLAAYRAWIRGWNLLFVSFAFSCIVCETWDNCARTDMFIGTSIHRKQVKTHVCTPSRNPFHPWKTWIAWNCSIVIVNGTCASTTATFNTGNQSFTAHSYLPSALEPGLGNLYAVAEDDEKIRSRSVIFGLFILFFGFLAMCVHLYSCI